MKTELIDKINNMDNFQVIRCFESFRRTVFSDLQLEMHELLTKLPSGIEMEDQIKKWQFLPDDVIEMEFNSVDAALFARNALLEFASNNQTSNGLEKFLSNYKENEMAVGTLLVLGGVISMIMLVATSKLEIKNGKMELIIGGLRNPAEIKALGEMIKNILGAIPDSLLQMLKL